MVGISNNAVNSAIVSGQLGLQSASNGITQASFNIAQRNAEQSLSDGGPSAVLAQASAQSLSTIRQILPQSGSSLTSDLLSLQINRNNAVASSKVLDTAFDTVGNIIDILA